MILIDGSSGEGGGQIIRTSLSLSLITGTAFRINKIRSGRKNPGLQTQHLAAVRAAAEIGGAKVTGDRPGSSELEFHPGEIRPGSYSFRIGTAGSTTLVFQTILPPLMMASAPSQLSFEGGTHNLKAPTFDFIEKTFAPLISRMGPGLSVKLERYGFFPPGGGRFDATISPSKELSPIRLLERTAIYRKQVRALVANLPAKVGERELSAARKALPSWSPSDFIVDLTNNAPSPGNVLFFELSSAEITEIVSSIGQRGLPAETVAESAINEASKYLESGAPVGEHLADQLLLPLAITGAGSFMTLEPSLHTKTNIELIKKFMDIDFSLERVTEKRWLIEVIR